MHYPLLFPVLWLVPGPASLMEKFGNFRLRLAGGEPIHPAEDYVWRLRDIWENGTYFECTIHRTSAHIERGLSPRTLDPFIWPGLTKASASSAVPQQIHIQSPERGLRSGRGKPRPIFQLTVGHVPPRLVVPGRYLGGNIALISLAEPRVPRPSWTELMHDDSIAR
jgi:hypothetical protein